MQISPRWKRARTPAIVLGAVVATAALTSTSLAQAAVHYVVLGGRNSSAATTTLTDTARSGVPLSLNAGRGAAPLAVNSTRQVNRFNAEFLQGHHSSWFAQAGGQTGIIWVQGNPATAKSLADLAASCPKGTKLTGGGGLGVSGAPLYYSGPLPLFDSSGAFKGAFDSNSWLALPTDDGQNWSFAVCYNPTGPVPGAVTARSATKGAVKVAPSLRKLLSIHK